MFVWRNALVLGVAFMVVGVVYWYLQTSVQVIDLLGATVLFMLGVSMAIVFGILLYGSREL